jgi:hypothetical protein
MTQVTSKEHNHRFNQIRISQERPTRLPHDDNDGATELYLENGTMDKQSYVVLEHIFEVPASQLRSCSFRSGSCAYESRLCEQSYILLMGRLRLVPENWVHTTLLKLGIASAQETLRHEFQSRTFGDRGSFVTQPLAQQSLRAGNAIPQAIQPVATNPVFLSPYQYTEGSPFLTNNISSTMPGVCRQQSVTRDSHYGAYSGHRRFEQSRGSNYDAYSRYEWFEQSRDSTYDAYSRYERFEQSRRVAPPEDDSENTIFSFKNLLILLAASYFVWWVG